MALSDLRPVETVGIELQCFTTQWDGTSFLGRHASDCLGVGVIMSNDVISIIWGYSDAIL